MPKTKLTKTAVNRIEAPDPSGKQVLHWDLELKGFGVLASGTTKVKTYVAQRTLPDGKTRRMTIGQVGEIDLETARSKAGDLIHAMRNGQDPKAARRLATAWTLRRAVDEYIAAFPHLKPNTKRDYQAVIKKGGWLDDWADIPLASIREEMVEDRHRHIQATIERRQTNPAHWSSQTGAPRANATFVIFRALYNFADLRADNLPRNPTRILRRQWFKQPRRKRFVIGDKLLVFYAAVDALDNPTTRDFIKLCLFTGLRRSEASLLRWDPMIDFAGRVIRLPADITKAGRKLDLPMTSFVRDLLIARRALGNDNGWVFASDSAAGHLREPRHAFAAIAAASGVQVSSHDLRRTYITVAESIDISLLALKALVNHATGNDVTAGYAQMTTERLRQPAQLICDRLMALCGIDAVDDQKVSRLG
jgi:integrase